MRLSFAHSFRSLVIPLTPSRDCRWLLDRCNAVRPVRPSSPSVVSKPHSVMFKLSRPMKGPTSTSGTSVSDTWQQYEIVILYPKITAPS